MKKLNITKEAFEKSKYFTEKYGKLEYVSESGKMFKTSKGRILKFKESTKKFGKKFNEGAYHDKHYLTIRDYDNLPDEEKGNYIEPMFGIGMVVNLTDKFYKNTDMYGRMEPKTGWRIKKARYMKRSKIWDYYIVNDDSLGDGFWAEEDWICDEYDESTKKRFGRKSVKESVGDVSRDPAYVCPYCGGRNCGFEDADDSPLEGYFDGGTLNAQFYCNDCDKFYNVTYELKVKDVYPNEDADELGYDESTKVDEAIPKTLKEIPKERAEKLIQKHLRAGTGEWDGSPGYSDFVYEIGGGRYKLIRPGFGGRYETGVVSM